MQGRWFGLIGLLLIANTSWASDRDSIAPFKIPLDNMPAARRAAIKSVLDKPTLSARSSKETFDCQPDQYRFILDHPDRGVVAWRRLGAKCVTIASRGPNTFAWTDDKGSELVWETVQNCAGQRVWFAEGKVKPGPLLPAVPVKAVVVLRYIESEDAEHHPVISQQTLLYAHTDSKSAALITKMLGNSAQHVAVQGLDQLQLFFSGLSWYMHRYPERSVGLLND